MIAPFGNEFAHQLWRHDRWACTGPGMSLLDTYLANALMHRQSAAKADLPNRRAMHERSAEAWEEMARDAEITALRAAINLAAKSIVQT